MTRVFIVRPFGKRTISMKDKTTGTVTSIQFDFDKVEKDLIRPSMDQTQLSGGTTGEVFESGDIREDMFSDLLLADVVIADITIHNANVFYELGIRHALREKRTILIKCPGFDDTPFDILGLRYTAYDRENPSASVTALVESVRETLAAERKDSPVFNILPELIPQDTEKYLAVPKDFVEEVTIASSANLAGKLSLLADEASFFTWQLPALRMIAEPLFSMKYFQRAKDLWEKVKTIRPGDIAANDRLATIYQRLAENEFPNNPEGGNQLLTQSDLAIDQMLNKTELGSVERAEAWALKGRNAKSRWISSWKDAAGSERLSKALRSPFLLTAFEDYEKGFYEDLNHFYAGVNALGLLIITISLAKRWPAEWLASFDSDEDAGRKLEDLKLKISLLTPSLELSIKCAKSRSETNGINDPWIHITEGDFKFLTATNPARVAHVYGKALENAAGLNLEATIRQLKLYEELGVRAEFVEAALNAIPTQKTEEKSKEYTLLFTGHMIDLPGRTQPRFPPPKEKEVNDMIRERLKQVINKLKKDVSITGIAGGACGGDILFLENCGELGIPCKMLLALPREQFLKSSVAFAGNSWIERFDVLYQSIPHLILANQSELPAWLRKKPGYNIWMRNNLWELHTALLNGGPQMTLIALWDGQGGDGPGGTQHMISIANEKGAKVEIIELK